MRLWSIHPGYLDAKGLVALWREGLLAQKVLRGQTRGYKNHPQLIRFKQTENPVAAIATYLTHVLDEAERCGYHFNGSKIAHEHFAGEITVTQGQIDYEFTHLLKKLKIRDPERYEKLKALNTVETHPMLQKVDGDVEDWEIV